MVKCEECGKEFESDAALRGHAMQHKRWDKKEDDKIEQPRQENRKERVPFGSPKARLPHAEDPNFVYRVFNDNWMREPDRILRAKAAGYEEVEGQDQITVGTNEDGTAIKGVLMRIPKKFFEEDQASKRKEIDKVDREIHRGAFQEKASDKRYIPPGGINIEDKLTP